MAACTDILKFLDDYLDAPSIDDCCPNGLQVEGRKEIRKIVTGVTACQLLIDRAAELGADALLVHHGIFWKGDDIHQAKCLSEDRLLRFSLHRAVCHLYR